MQKQRWVFAIFVVTLLLITRPALAVVNGQIDDFEDGTTAFWTNGGLAGVVPVTNIPTGGPAGANDNYIRITSDGSGAGGRLTVYNRDQWLGSYPNAGVASIEVDLRNEGSTSLSIRLAFKTGPGNGIPGFLSAPMVLPVGSGWQHFSISLLPANLIPINNPGSFNNFFIGETRFIHEVGATDLNGTPIVGMLGIDNIRAVPEPTALTLFGAGVLLAFAAKRPRNLRRASRA
jgi:hypothetical protein